MPRMSATLTLASAAAAGIAGWCATEFCARPVRRFIELRSAARRQILMLLHMPAAVEMLAAELWPDAISGVATVPDPRKGERIVLVTTRKDPVRSDLILFARSRGASEMMVPSEVLIVEKLPLLGSGKIDYIALQNLVNERVKLEGAVA